jgi:hypothetical protein
VVCLNGYRPSVHQPQVCVPVQRFRETCGGGRSDGCRILISVKVTHLQPAEDGRPVARELLSEIHD